MAKLRGKGPERSWSPCGWTRKESRSAAREEIPQTPQKAHKGEERKNLLAVFESKADFSQRSVSTTRPRFGKRIRQPRGAAASAGLGARRPRVTAEPGQWLRELLCAHASAS